MQLVQNSYKDTLSEAAALIGISKEQLKTDREQNIRGEKGCRATSRGIRNPKP